MGGKSFSVTPGKSLAQWVRVNRNFNKWGLWEGIKMSGKWPGAHSVGLIWWPWAQDVRCMVAASPRSTHRRSYRDPGGVMGKSRPLLKWTWPRRDFRVDGPLQFTALLPRSQAGLATCGHPLCPGSSSLLKTTPHGPGPRRGGSDHWVGLAVLPQTMNGRLMENKHQFLFFF